MPDPGSTAAAAAIGAKLFPTTYSSFSSRPRPRTFPKGISTKSRNRIQSRHLSLSVQNHNMRLPKSGRYSRLAKFKLKIQTCASLWERN